LAITGAVAAIATALAMSTVHAGERVFVADLSRSKSYISAEAHARVKFSLNDEGTEIGFEVVTEKVPAIFQIHIHLDPRVLARGSGRFPYQVPTSKHGPIVTFLVDAGPKGITKDGVVATGTLRESQLVGPLRRSPLSFLVELMENEDTYIAVHVLKPLGAGNTFCCPVGLRGVIREERP
jgi:hypothetical protein